MKCKAQEWEGSQGTFAADSVAINLPGCVLPYIWYLFNGLKEIKWSNVIWEILACSADFFFFSQLHEDKRSNRSRVWGWALWDVIEGEHLDRNNFHPILEKSFNICLSQWWSAGESRLRVAVEHFISFLWNSVIRTAKCIFLSDRGLGCVNLISDKTEVLHWGILI